MRRVLGLVLGLALIAGNVGGGRAAIASRSAAPAATPAAAEPIEPPAAVGGDYDAFTPVVVALVGGNTAAVRGSDGRYHVVYELLLTNTAAGPAQLRGVTVLDAADATAVLGLTGAEMVASQALRLLDTQPAADATLPANAARVLLLDVTFAAAAAVPHALTHRLDILSPSSFSDTPAPFSYQAGVLDLSRRTPPVLSPSLAGNGWIAAEGCCDPSSHHRNGVWPINGGLYAGQRFGIDWIRIDAAGRLVTGGPADVANWVGYGAKVMAAADGVVIAAEDGLPNQTPGVQPDLSTMALAENDGNHVVIDHGNGF